MREATIAPGQDADSWSRTPSASRELSASKRKLARVAGDRAGNSTRGRSRRARRSEPSALSFGQRRLWFLDRWSPGSTAYNEFVASAPRRTARRRSAAGEPGRGPSSATPSCGPYFARRAAGPLSGRRARASCRWWSSTISRRCSESERAGRVRRHPAARAVVTVRSGAGPLVRARLVRAGPIAHELFVAVHHIACDGWSLGIFVRELGARLHRHRERRRAGVCRRSTFSTPTTRDGSARPRRAPTPVAQLDYWKRQLSPTLRRCSTCPARARFRRCSTSAGLTEFFTLDADLAPQGASVSRATRTPPPSWCCWRRFRRCCTATPARPTSASARRWPGGRASRPSRSSGSSSTRWSCAATCPAIRASASSCAGCASPVWRRMPIQDVPFEHLVERLRTRRDLEPHPALSGDVRAAERAARRARPSRPADHADRGRPRHREVRRGPVVHGDRRGRFNGALECSADLFDAASVGEWPVTSPTLLSSAVRRPGRAGLATAAAVRRASGTTAGLAGADPRRSRCDEPLASGVRPSGGGASRRTSPCAAASSSSTYGELDRRANRWRTYLRSAASARRPGRPLPGAVDRAGGRAARHPQGRRRVRAARPALSSRSAWPS